jgi:hypothetical protein
VKETIANAKRTNAGTLEINTAENVERALKTLHARLSQKSAVISRRNDLL